MPAIRPAKNGYLKKKDDAAEAKMTIDAAVWLLNLGI
jgi:hypothetical protein